MSSSENLDTGYAGDGIYRENIMDHFKNPRNFGTVENPDIRHREYNPLCGDEIEIFIKLSSDRASEVRFRGRGCAISKSAASMLTEALQGKTLDEIKKITGKDILDMLAIPVGPVRMKCAMLSLDTLRNGIFIFEKYGKEGAPACRLESIG